jgi:enoyl-CoA hydratase
MESVSDGRFGGAAAAPDSLHRGLRVLLTGRHITAAEASDIGLIGHVVPDGQALTKALELAETINGNGPLAVQAILQSIRETEGLPENEALQIDTRLGVKVFLSDDAKEGPKAFAEKRTPQFSGR